MNGDAAHEVKQRRVRKGSLSSGVPVEDVSMVPPFLVFPFLTLFSCTANVASLSFASSATSGCAALARQVFLPADKRGQRVSSRSEWSESVRCKVERRLNLGDLCCSFLGCFIWSTFLRVYNTFQCHAPCAQWTRRCTAAAKGKSSLMIQRQVL